jgi:Holliday junction resolvasome RuvABC ATP-dependent DNA helicase subunit
VADRGFHYADLIGQEDAIAKLRAFTDLFASSGTTPGHILLIGDDGMGQSTIAKSVATECGAVAGKSIEIQPLNLAGTFSSADPPSERQVALCHRLRIPIPAGANRGQVSAALDKHYAKMERRTEPNRPTEPRLTKLENAVWFIERSAASFENFGDFRATLTNLRKGEFLLLSNLQLLRKVYWNGLRSVMRDGRLRDHVIEVPPFTLIATCPRKSDCPADLFSEFSLVLTLQPYSKTELQALAVSMGTSAGVSLELGAAELIARASDGRPAILRLRCVGWRRR